MNLSFDSIFFLVFGLVSLSAGILKSDRLFWTSMKYDRLKDLFGKNYIQFVNISWGIVSLFVGLYLLQNK